MDTVTGSVTIQHGNPRLAGEVTFHLATLYEQIRIGRRVAQMSVPMQWEQLPPDERALTRMLATLEHVIDTAPEGFYITGPDGKPVLAPGEIVGPDVDVLWAVYKAYIELEDSFRGRSGAAGGAETAS